MIVISFCICLALKVAVRDESRPSYFIKDNKKVEVKSIVDALNFVSSKGWEYVSQYTEEDYGITLYWFVFKKKVSSIQDVYKEFPLHSNINS